MCRFWCNLICDVCVSVLRGSNGCLDTVLSGSTLFRYDRRMGWTSVRRVVYAVGMCVDVCAVVYVVECGVLVESGCCWLCSHVVEWVCEELYCFTLSVIRG